MDKKLTKHGNSLALIIDKPILQLLKIDEKTILTLTTDGNKIIIEPISKKKAKISNDTTMQKSYNKIIKKYGPALKKLSNN